MSSSEYVSGRGRGTKRKLAGGNGGNGGNNGGSGSASPAGHSPAGLTSADFTTPTPKTKKSKGELSTPKLSANAFPKEHPFNRDGYRYVLAEADVHAPFRREFDESTDLAGKPIPGFLCRVLTPETVLLALHDRAQQMTVTHEDRLTVTGYKFYCTVRANHFVNLGTWYYEAKVVDIPEGAAARIGWAQRYANLQAPLGFDKFGYSMRSRKGTRFHQSIGKHYAEGGYKAGDYIGCLIELPDRPGFADYLPHTYKDKPLVKFKSHFYFEEKDRVTEAEKALEPLPGSKITFFKNGECLGTAFTDVFAGDYYPAVASYKSAKVKFNFGPKFRFPPKGYKHKPMSARADLAAVEQTVADMRFFTEKEGQLSLNNYFMSPWIQYLWRGNYAATFSNRCA